MNRDEALAFIQKIENGYKYYNRMHENEWGINYLGNEQYKEWVNRSEMYQGPNGNIQYKTSSSEQTHDKEQLIKFLTENYSYEIMLKGLIKKV